MICKGDTFELRDGTIVRKSVDGTEEEWGTIQDLDTLFDSCVHRWGSNWNLEKVCTAIEESEID